MKERSNSSRPPEPKGQPRAVAVGSHVASGKTAARLATSAFFEFAGQA